MQNKWFNYRNTLPHAQTNQTTLCVRMLSIKRTVFIIIINKFYLWRKLISMLQTIRKSWLFPDSDTHFPDLYQKRCLSWLRDPHILTFPDRINLVILPGTRDSVIISRDIVRDWKLCGYCQWYYQLWNIECTICMC